MLKWQRRERKYRKRIEKSLLRYWKIYASISPVSASFRTTLVYSFICIFLCALPGSINYATRAHYSKLATSTSTMTLATAAINIYVYDAQLWLSGKGAAATAGKRSSAQTTSKIAASYRKKLKMKCMKYFASSPKKYATKRATQATSDK